AEVGAKRIAADDGLDVVIAVAGSEAAHDADLVRQASEAREGAAEGHAGDARLHFAGGAAALDRSTHLRIERLDLAGPAVQEQEDDGMILEYRPARLRSGGFRLQQIHERQTAQREAADFEEGPAIETIVPIENGKHGISPLKVCK